MASGLKFSSLKESFSQTPATLKLAWKSAPGMSSALFVLTILAAGLPLAVAYVGKAIVDAVVVGSREGALHYVFLELLLIVVLALATRGLMLVKQLLAARLAVDINLQILAKAQTLELSHFEDPTFYDQLNRARREASLRPVSVVNDTFQLIQNTLTVVGYMALLLAYSPWAVAGLFLASLPAALAEIHYSNAAFRLRNWHSPEWRQLNYIEYVLSNDAHAKEVKVFGLGDSLLGRYRDTSEGIYRDDRNLALRRAGWAYVLSLIGTFAFYACYAIMAVAAVNKRMSLGDLTLYVLVFRQGQQAFQAVLQAIGSMYENNLYMSNLFSYFAIPVGQHAPAVAAPPAAEEGIRFENVGYRYPGQENWALRHIDLFIPRGQSLALVGHNGAGKSTLIKLLARLYDVSEGRILLDGKDLREWDRATLLRRIAVVFQDFNRYQFSAEDNVRFGDIHQPSDATRIGRAIEHGGARELIDSLPQGLQTPLGRWFVKSGTELSGGQWQKIALARGFMREDADILILDEPTAALDAEAEFAVFERFRTLTKGRTSLLISHRFPTIRMADRIIVIEGGRLVESGTHDELVHANGGYAQLFALQAKGYL